MLRHLSILALSLSILFLPISSSADQIHELLQIDPTVDPSQVDAAYQNFIQKSRYDFSDPNEAADVYLAYFEYCKKMFQKFPGVYYSRRTPVRVAPGRYRNQPEFAPPYDPTPDLRYSSATYQELNRLHNSGMNIADILARFKEHSEPGIKLGYQLFLSEKLEALLREKPSAKVAGDAYKMLVNPFGDNSDFRSRFKVRSLSELKTYLSQQADESELGKMIVDSMRPKVNARQGDKDLLYLDDVGDRIKNFENRFGDGLHSRWIDPLIKDAYKQMSQWEVSPFLDHFTDLRERSKNFPPHVRALINAKIVDSIDNELFRNTQKTPASRDRAKFYRDLIWKETVGILKDSPESAQRPTNHWAYAYARSVFGIANCDDTYALMVANARSEIKKKN